MPEILYNSFRGHGLPGAEIFPSQNAEAVAKLLAQCPVHAKTPLVSSPELAEIAGIEQLWLKDERARMGLGSFKALGAAYSIAYDAAASRPEDWSKALNGTTYATASAGNHGLSVAAGARVFGARAVIYLAHTVPEAFAERLRALGADVVRAGEDYEASMDAARVDANCNDWNLLSDSTWPGATGPGSRIMEGYLQMAAEAATQIPNEPSHILLQAGVGGLAASVAAHARAVWGDAPVILVVEPAAAPALIESIRLGKLVDTSGPVSSMGRLDCKTPSLVALNGLARDADVFVTISEEEAENGLCEARRTGFDSTTSGVAGIAALLAGVEGVGADAKVLCFLSEGPENG